MSLKPAVEEDARRGSARRYNRQLWAQRKQGGQEGKEARIRPEPHVRCLFGEKTSTERKPRYARSPMIATLLARRRPRILQPGPDAVGGGLQAKKRGRHHVPRCFSRVAGGGVQEVYGFRV